MGRAVIEHDGEATLFTVPRNPLLVVASVAAILICAGISGVVLRADGGEPTMWTWLLPAVVTLGLLPGILTAIAPQRLRIDPEAIVLERWFGRQRIAWGEAVEATGYSNGQDLFLRIRTARSRLLLSTRWAGWDAGEMRAIARRIETILEERHPHVERPGPLDRFPSWFSKESGLGSR